MTATGRGLTFDHSRELHAAASKLIPGGVNSNVRFGEQPHPLFFERGEGPYLYDVDGNRIIDYVMGQGPMILGHRPAFVIDAVVAQMEKGLLYGAQHELEIAVAELVTRLVPSAEVVRFNMTGTEAVQAALRIARAATGRDLILKFEGHYHGWADSVLFNVASGSGPRGDGPDVLPVAESKGIAAEASNALIVAPWNDSQLLEQIVAPVADSVAAIIMEPVMANSGAIEPGAGYLKAVRELCDRHGIVLIFDEVITGFRAHAGGAQARYGVTPDLTTMGKAMASGFPIGCVAGRRSLMEGIASGQVTHAGTFNGTPISMAAAHATLQYLDDAGADWYARLEERGSRLRDGFAAALATHGFAAAIQGLPTIFNIMFTDRSEVRNHQDVLETDREARTRLQRSLMSHGVRISGHGNVFLSAAHDDDVIDESLERFQAALATMTAES